MLNTPWISTTLRNLGVNLDELLISQPDSGEQALEIVDTLIRSGAIDLIIVDSVAALTPKQEIEGEMGDIARSSQARLMSKASEKTHSSHQPFKLYRHLHQPAANENRCHVWLSRNHNWWKCTEVLCIHAT